MRFFAALSIFAMAAATGCARFGPVYPAHPTPGEGAPFADPAPSRIVAHLAIASAALRSALDDVTPRIGEGTFPLLGSDRRYTWERGPLEVGFSQGRVVLSTKVRATVFFAVEVDGRCHSTFACWRSPS